MDQRIKNKIKEYHEKYPDNKIVVLIQTGSHMFGLNTPESDLDISGIFLPSQKELISGNFLTHIDLSSNKSKLKNNKEDIDFKLYPILDFFDLLARGDFNSMEWLYSPSFSHVLTTPLWKEIQELKENFLVFDIHSFLGFMKGELSAKGISGNSYVEIETIYNFIKDRKEKYVKDIAEEFHQFDFVEFIDTRVSNNRQDVRIPTLEFANRKYQTTIRVEYMAKELKELLAKSHASHRKDEDGVDVKGLYHCQRLIYEAEELIYKHTLTIPLHSDQNEYLRKIRRGEVGLEDLKNKVNEDIIRLKEIKRKMPKSTNSINAIYTYSDWLFNEMKMRAEIKKYLK